MDVRRGVCLLGLALAASFGDVVYAEATQPPKQFTEWGWPQPYERVSEKSINWLKAKGWWPLQWGYQPPWMAQNTIPPLVRELGLDRKRGLEIELKPFLAGPPLNEGLVGGKLQIGSGGNFPVTSLIDKQAPLKAVGVIWTPLYGHPIVIHSDSSIKRPEDLKGKVIGLVVGSSAEFAFVAWAKAHGLDPRRDVTIKSMPIPDQATMPRGIDAVVPWDPTPRLIIQYRKNGELFDDPNPYQLYWGSLHVREELLDNAPDVVQAIVDMCVEGLLWARINLGAAVEILNKDPALQAYPKPLLHDESMIWLVNLKPSWMYPFVDLYAGDGARVAKWLHEGGRTRTLLTEAAYRDYFRHAQRFMDATYAKLGWRIPTRPPYLPQGMTSEGVMERLLRGDRIDLIWPYKMTQPQPFPEAEDLAKPWYYAGRWYNPKR